MGKAPTYFSETITSGPHTYLMEVKRSQGGKKYFVISRTNVRDEEQQAVLVFGHEMPRFMKLIERAAETVYGSFPEIEPRERSWAPKRARQVKPRRPGQAKKKGPPRPNSPTNSSAESDKGAAEVIKRRPNQGRRWTKGQDSLLITHYKEGMSIAELAELLGRGPFSIEVRISKLGLTRSKW